jgi:invasion protein IalB
MGGLAVRLLLCLACALGLGLSAATAQQVQDVPKTPSSAAPKTPSYAAPKEATKEESAWVKLCTKEGQAEASRVCLVRYEGLEPKTGAVLIAAAVRTVEGQDKVHLLVNVPTSRSLVIPSGAQIKIDDGEPVQLQYSVCLPSNCQVQMEVSKDMLAKMRKGRQLFVAAMNAQGQTIAFPISLAGFSKTSDGPPVDNAAYQAARAQMHEAARKHQMELAREAQQQKQ